MPEFIFINVQQCSMVEGSGKIGGYSQYNIGPDWMCTCPAYMYARKPKTCKHLKEWLETRCTWHSQFGQAQTEEQKKQRICPECGAPTVLRQFAV